MPCLRVLKRPTSRNVTESGYERFNGRVDVNAWVPYPTLGPHEVSSW